MIEPSPRAEGSRSSLLPVVMLGILVLAVAVAWSLSASRQRLARRGAELVAQVRKDGLPAHWRSFQSRWLLAQKAGRYVGWRATVRLVEPQGAAEGFDVSVLATGQHLAGAWERWSLDAGLSQGEYRSGLVLPGRVGPQLAQDTVIRYADKTVEVVQGIAQHSVQSRAPAPANYLPEGTLELAFRLAAMRKIRAQFRTIENSVPPAGQTTQFITVLAEPFDASASGVVGAAFAVNVRFFLPGGSMEQAWLFDDQGNLLQKTDREAFWTLASADQLAEHFPAAPRQLASILERLGLPTASEPSQEQDEEQDEESAPPPILKGDGGRQI